VSEVHLFVLWSNARDREEQILADVAATFVVLDLVEVEWQPHAFARNLTCFYGTDLPAGSDKERQSGTGPFLVCVIEDDRPRYRYRRVGRRLVRKNSRTIEARTRYRAMTGGGFRVHASADAREAARDLFLLFGRRPSAFRGAGAPSQPRRHADGMLGERGWRDLDELMGALAVTSGVERIDPPAGVDLAFAVDDLWWAVHVVNGAEVSPGRWRVDIGGSSRTVALEERRRRRFFQRVRA
jgi:hypothetical protein